MDIAPENQSAAVLVVICTPPKRLIDRLSIIATTIRVAANSRSTQGLVSTPQRRPIDARCLISVRKKNPQLRTAARIIRLLDIVMSRAPEQLTRGRRGKTTMLGEWSLPLCQPKSHRRNNPPRMRRLRGSISD
jgi:hypothetical protein